MFFIVQRFYKNSFVYRKIYYCNNNDKKNFLIFIFILINKSLYMYEPSHFT